MQIQLSSGVDPRAEQETQTVYVVTVRWMDSPHPDVLGVYDNEQDADKLMQQCRDWPREYPGLGPVAWEKREQEIQREFDAEEVKEQVP